MYRVLVMDIFARRDQVFKALYDHRDSQPAPSSLAKTLNEKGIEISAQEISEVYEWLYKNGLINNDQRPALTALGENFIDTGTSVLKLAEAQAQGAINQTIQNNTSTGSGVVFSQGNNNTFNLNTQLNGVVDDVIDVLRKEGEESRASELKAAKDQDGAGSAVKTLAQWLKRGVFTPKVLGALSPIISTILTIAFG